MPSLGLAVGLKAGGASFEFGQNRGGMVLPQPFSTHGSSLIVSFRPLPMRSTAVQAGGWIRAGRVGFISL